jgi:hypothetical protein
MNAPSMCTEHAIPEFISDLAHAELLSCRLTSLVDLIRLANDADTINPGSRDLLVSLLTTLRLSFASASVRWPRSMIVS